MRKKAFALLLSIVLVLSIFLAGCGNDAASGDKVVIDFWANQFEETTDEWFKKWVDEYNQSQDKVEIRLQIVPGDAWAQKLKAAQAAGKAPQVYTMNYSNIAPSVAKNQLTPLDEYTDAAIWDDLLDNVEEFVTVKGEHYAYPKLVEPSAVLYYRKDYFEKAGLDPEQPPQTWDELIDYGKKLKTNNRYGLHIANNADELAWSTWGLQRNGGREAVNDEWTKATLDKHYLDLITFYQRIYAEKIAPAQALSEYTDLQDFGEGKVAMAVSGSWGIGQLRNDYPDILDNVGVAVMPSPDGDHTKPVSTLGGWTLVIDGRAENPQEAADFISWLLAGDTEIMVDFFRTSKFSKFPTRTSVEEALNEDPEGKKDEVRKLIAEKVVPNSVSEPIYPWEISFAYGSAIERAIKGQHPQKALKQAEAEINDYIKKNNLAGINPKQ
ncbi:extracellular solute-binding protein [Desmospora activa]|uniref:Carbohydrate ABC transporter substrate-binding protein (CUT1 family) n=1 Tax=Desmospora activa DSM 45169 TaxID=1121389 RepID=A0A2T4ZD53_9BACL|nr:extracellular solute-binding protein [Desmospora activa]PTM59802.1 carbohydrate ABC transporter substrate-binding protein (CUT1 family) [Desmospora activa DSM 45169]